MRDIIFLGTANFSSHGGGIVAIFQKESPNFFSINPYLALDLKSLQTRIKNKKLAGLSVQEEQKAEGAIHLHGTEQEITVSASLIEDYWEYCGRDFRRSRRMVF